METNQKIAIIKRRGISLILKLITIIAAVVGTILSSYGGSDSFMGNKTVFMFFTIQSNIAVAIISAIGIYYILSEKEVSYLWAVIRHVGAVSITLTGLVFCFVLAPTLGGGAWNTHNVLTHVIVPLAYVVDFFLSGVGKSLSKASVGWVILPPLLYVIYAGIGYALGWKFYRDLSYPYFFLNWGSPAGAFGFTDQLPFMGVMWWIILILGFLILVGHLYRIVAGKINSSIIFITDKKRR